MRNLICINITNVTEEDADSVLHLKNVGDVMRWLRALIPALLLAFVGPAMAEKQHGGMNMGGDMNGGHMMQGKDMGNGGMMNMPMMRDHMKEMQQHMRQMSKTKNPEKRMEQMQEHMKKMQRHMEMMQHMMEVKHGDGDQGGMMNNRQGGDR